MKWKVYAVRDAVAEVFMPPFFFRHEGEAIRAFYGSCRNPETVMAECPDHFSLWHLGTWDDVSGAFELMETPLFVVAGQRGRKDDGFTREQASEQSERSVFDGSEGGDSTE